jgi:acyl-CoA thioesterase FadM
MLDRCDLEPLFFAPFVSSVMKVEPGWIDYNGHLNMAYYNVLFDRAVDEAYELLGIGAGYVERARRSLYTAEVHIRYLRELHAGDPVRVTFQLLGHDAKRLHYFEQLFHAADGWYRRRPRTWPCTSPWIPRRPRRSPPRSQQGSPRWRPRTRCCRAPKPPAAASPCRRGVDREFRALS